MPVDRRVIPQPTGTWTEVIRLIFPREMNIIWTFPESWSKHALFEPPLLCCCQQFNATTPCHLSRIHCMHWTQRPWRPTWLHCKKSIKSYWDLIDLRSFQSALQGFLHEMLRCRAYLAWLRWSGRRGFLHQCLLKCLVSIISALVTGINCVDISLDECWIILPFQHFWNWSCSYQRDFKHKYEKQVKFSLCQWAVPRN